MAQPAVLFEDNHCLAMCKPVGLLTQGVSGAAPSLEDAARDYLRANYGKKGRVYLGIPHRLDRPVSGVVLFAKSSKAAARLAEQFRDRVVRKVYWAVLESSSVTQSWHGPVTWTDHMRKVSEESRAEIVEAGAEGAKLAEMEVECLGWDQAGLRVEMRPVTGRMHQLRLQAASRGLPIVGDQQYGAKAAVGLVGSREAPIALHARWLRFLHPIRYEPVELTAPLPPHWPANP